MAKTLTDLLPVLSLSELKRPKYVMGEEQRASKHSFERVSEDVFAKLTEPFSRYTHFMAAPLAESFYEITQQPDHYTAQYIEEQLNAVATKRGFRFLRTTLLRLGNGILDSFEARGHLLCPCGQLERWSGYFFDGGLQTFIERLLADSITREHIEEDVRAGRLPPSALDAFDDQGEFCVSTDTPSG